MSPGHDPYHVSDIMWTMSRQIRKRGDPDVPRVWTKVVGNHVLTVEKRGRDKRFYGHIRDLKTRQQIGPKWYWDTLEGATEGLEGKYVTKLAKERMLFNPASRPNPVSLDHFWGEDRKSVV